MLQIKLFLLVGFTIAVQLLQAQQPQNCTFKLNGLVKDNEGAGLAGATVWIDSLDKATSTDGDGSFTFSSLCKGKYDLHVKFLGYEEAAILISVPSRIQPCVILKPSTKVLHDVIIEGEHAQQHNLSQSTALLQEEDLASKKGKSLGEMIQKLPGVNSLATGPSVFKPVIHGLHSQRILILNNGVRQEGQQWGIEHAPEIDPFIASEIEVVYGSETVRYGADAIGGVVIVNPQPLSNTTPFGGTIHTSWMSNNRQGTVSALLQGPFEKFKKWSWRLQSTAKKGGDFEAAQYRLSNTGLEELNFSGTVAFNGDLQKFELYVSSFNSNLGILRSAHSGNLEDFQNAIVSERPWYIADFSYTIENPRQEINHQLIKLKSTTTLGNTSKLNLLYGFQYNRREEYDIRRGGRSEKPALSLDLINHMIDASVDFPVKNWVTTVGLSGTLKDNTNKKDLGVKPLIPDYNQFTSGIFVIEKLKHEKWLLEFGVRYDRQYLQALIFDNQNKLQKPAYNFNLFSCSVGASYYFSTKARVLLNFGLSIRPPHVSELFSQGLHRSTASIEEGILLRQGEWNFEKKQIQDETVKKIISTFQFSEKKLSFEVSAYANRIDNYIHLTPIETRLTTAGHYPVFQYQQANALLLGADGMLTWSATKSLSFQQKISYLTAKDISSNDRFLFIPPVQFEEVLTFKKSFRRMKDTFISVGVSSTLRQNQHPQIIHPVDVPNNERSNKFDFMQPPPAYTLMNLETGTTFYFGKNELRFSIGFDNLLNTAYRNYMNRLRYYADDLGRNISIRLTYDFHSHKN